MSAYYNEHDRFAAAWLRELIKADLIANGEVDERDINEVQPEDMRGFTQCHLFAGIGVWSYALRAAGWTDDTPVWTGSCPCQSFSTSGKRQGFSDKRHLWPAWFRLIRELRPQHVFGEQVASKDGLAWFDLVSSDLEGAGYTVGACDTCAAGFGAPHKRNRLYWIATMPHSDRFRSQGIIHAKKESWPLQQFERLVQDQLRDALPSGKSGALSDGSPARVGRLRGYGNALVAPQAQAFIEAYLDHRGG